MQMTKTSAGAVLLQAASTITEKEQLLCNTHNSTICQIIFMNHFTNHVTGRQKNANFNQKLILDILISSITKHKGFFN